MKKIITLLLVFLLLQMHAFALNVPSGTLVVVQPQKIIDADDLKVGDDVKFTVVQPVKVNNTTVLPIGTEVLAKVIKKKNNCVLGIPGNIQVGEFSIITQNNEIMRLSGTVSDEGNNRYWANVGWIFVFPLLFIKGDDGKIRQETTHMLHTVEDIEL